MGYGWLMGGGVTVLGVWQDGRGQVSSGEWPWDCMWGYQCPAGSHSSSPRPGAHSHNFEPACGALPALLSAPRPILVPVTQMPVMTPFEHLSTM